MTLRMKKMRADELIVKRGLVDSRSMAQALILSGKVRIGKDDVVAKPSRMLAEDANISINSDRTFVSRGGEKLAGFFKQFTIDVTGVAAMDVGASTGGFTDCLLQNGATSVLCVDVGRGQLHYKLQKDKRVTSIEKINARSMTHADLPRTNFDIIVIDVSFISLKKILPNVWQFLRKGGKLIALVKPQFEAEKNEVDKCGGVIKDPEIQDRILAEIINFSLENLPSAQLNWKMDSPIFGGDGNKEFLIGLVKE